MSSIQGFSSSSATAFTPRPQASAQATKSEAQETAAQERSEVLSGRQEAGESQPSSGGSSGLGGKVNFTA